MAKARKAAKADNPAGRPPRAGRKSPAPHKARGQSSGNYPGDKADLLWYPESANATKLFPYGKAASLVGCLLTRCGTRFSL